MIRSQSAGPGPGGLSSAPPGQAPMKVVVVSPFSVLPAHEGNKSRILSLIRQLRRLGHTVHLVLMPNRDAIHADLALHAAEMGPQPGMGPGRLVVIPRGRVSSLRHAVKRVAMETRRRGLSRLGLNAGFYNHLDEYFFAGSLPHLRRLHAAERYDAVFVEYVFMSRAFEAFSGALKVLDTHDTFADRHLAFGPRATPRSYWYSIPVASELAGMRRADVVLAIQDEEAALFRRRLGTPAPTVLTVSHTLSTEARVTDYAPAAGCFIGSSAEPNRDALDYFVEAVLPRVRAARPDFRLMLAGDICLSAPDDPAIVKLGRVESLLDAYAAGPVAINPMRIGTGINIKLLEALAHGVTAVTTTTGARGLDPTLLAGVDRVADDDPAAFADALVALLSDAPKRARRGDLALASARAWNAVQTAALADCLKEARR